MADRKKFAKTWDTAYKYLAEDGFVDIRTGGGEKWNNEVAEKLSLHMDKKVVFVGTSPDETDVYRFTMQMTSNQQAKMLLAKDDIR